MEQIDTRKVAQMGWVKRWAGSYTFISCSYWGYQYYSALNAVLGTQFDHTLFIHKRGVVSFYVLSNEFSALGTYLAKKATADTDLAKRWLNELKTNTDHIKESMRSLENKIPTLNEYETFLKYYERHLPYHNFMKKTVDFLAPKILGQLLPFFTESRLYSESVYSDTEQFFRGIMKKIGEAQNRDPELLTCLTKEEFELYIKNKILPDEHTLKDRFGSSILYFSHNKRLIKVGEVAVELEMQIARNHTQTSKEIKGISAYPGKAEGIARVVLDPFEPGEFNEGDILVTGMTRPEFLPLVKKAAAIVTDAGGILCHAAIIARELKKPCIVGVEVATKRIKSGNSILVDAYKGIITNEGA